MKKLITLTLLSLTGLTFGAIEFDEVRTTKTDFISIHSLSCHINLGSHRFGLNRKSTVLSRFFINESEFPKLFFKHETLAGAGCDLPVLDKMVDDSHTSFGHTLATVSLVQGTAKEPRMFRGKCVKNVREQVILDFGQGVVLESSSKGTLIPATGCN